MQSSIIGGNIDKNFGLYFVTCKQGLNTWSLNKAVQGLIYITGDGLGYGVRF